MQAWITDRPLKKKRRQRNEEMPRLELPLARPVAEREPELRDTKGDKDVSQRGVAEVDFYI